MFATRPSAHTISSTHLGITAISLVVLALGMVRVGHAADATVIAKQLIDASGVHGGLVVQLGANDGRLAAAIGAAGNFLVQGLADSPSAARAHIEQQGSYGRVTARTANGVALPYTDGIVNLIVATVPPARISYQELARVLAPGGVAMIRGTIDHPRMGLKSTAIAALPNWTKLTKPLAADTDQWTHYLHGPNNNAVANDTRVGPPRHFQWIGTPQYSRSHDHLSSVSTLVSAGGRIFYIVDMGSIAFAAARPHWKLVARDAYSGVLLWERAIDSWEYHLRDFRSGPADIARRLVADDERVYVTLGYGQGVSILDAVTGKTLTMCAATRGAHEIVHYRNTLLVVTGAPDRNWPADSAQQIVSQEGYRPPFRDTTPPVKTTRLVAVDATDGQVIWEHPDDIARTILPSTLAADDDRVFYQNAQGVICLALADGTVVWQAPRPIEHRRLAWSTPTLVVDDGVVLSADRKPLTTSGKLLWIPSGGYHEYIRGPGIEGELIAYDAASGQRLWSSPAYEGFNAPVDIMVIDGLVWSGRYAWGRDPGITEARDLHTGEVRRRRPAQPMGGHARCHRAKATGKYLILGRVGIEFFDTTSNDLVVSRWIRGMCQYGVMPANGLLYVPPHSCVCSIGDMVKSGFVALAPARGTKATPDAAPPKALEKGPAYADPQEVETAGADNGWPTYRHDSARSGVASCAAGTSFETAWSTALNGDLTAPVAVGEYLLVAQTNSHRVVCLDTNSGSIRWTYRAAARIDSPPTVAGGRALFGSADGHVYCVRLNDGQLIWRFRAADNNQMFVVNDQLESPWPVSGSVLAIDGAAYFTAGRNSYLDDGFYLYKLDITSGKMLKRLSLSVPAAQRDRGKTGAGFLPDVLSTDGHSLFLRGARFNFDLEKQKKPVSHLWSSVGFLDDNWWHRTYWQFGTTMNSGWGGWPKAGQRVPAGRLLVVDNRTVFGYGRNQYDIPGAHVGIDAEGVWGPIGKNQGRWTYYRLYRRRIGDAAKLASEKSAAGMPKATVIPDDWSRRIPVLVQAMARTNDELLVAGPTDPLPNIAHTPTAVDAVVDAINTTVGGRLLVIDPATGSTLADHPIDSPPVFDGLAVSNGQIFLATKNGSVVCLRGER